MAYIGRPLQVANLAVQSGTGDGSDTTPIATLDYATVTNGIAVYLDGVRQLAGTDFNVTAQTTLTFTTAPANGVGVDVYFLGLELSLPTPADASVIAAKIASNAVTSVKIIDDAVTLAKMAPGTDGNIISYDASGNPVAIATGSDGQVLTSTGAGSPPAFEAAGGGDCVFLSSTTAAGAASIDITSADGLDSSLYSHYGVYIGGVFCTTTSNSLVMRLSDDNGSSYDANGYNYSSRGLDDSGSSGDTATPDGTYIRIVASSGENSTPYAVWGWVWIPVSVAADPVGAHVTWHTAGLDSAEDSWSNMGSGQQETAPDSGGWDAFQFLPHNAGNLTGTVYIYGFKKS